MSLASYSVEKLDLYEANAKTKNLLETMMMRLCFVIVLKEFSSLSQLTSGLLTPRYHVFYNDWQIQ